MTARAARIAILLPPSEGKAAGGDGPPWGPGTMSMPDLDPARAAVLAALGGDVACQPTLPAVDRYTGVLYRELAAGTLPGVLRRRLDRQALVVSGLWGLVAPSDPIPAYRLKMSASLPATGRLSTWWRPTLTAALVPRLARHTVWDLLPNEHAAAWDPRSVPVRRRITVRFVDEADRTVSHWNKLLKGALVRHLLDAQPTDPADLVAFEHPAGYRLDLTASRLDDDPAMVVLRAGG